MDSPMQDSDPILTEQLLEEIRRRIVRAYAPDQVILFGSYAEGRAMADSDVDVLVVTRRGLEGQQHLGQPWDLFCDLAVPVQVVAMSPQEFEETHDVIGGMAYPAAKYGRVIYEKS